MFHNLNFQTLDDANIEVLNITKVKLFRFQNTIDLKKKKEKTPIRTISQQVQDKVQKIKDSPYSMKEPSNRSKKKAPNKKP